MTRPIAAAAAALLGLAGLGCASERDAATRLVAAAQPGHLPQVVACWEKVFEAAGFHGQFVAIVDFTVEAETSRLHGAKVVAMEPPGSDDGAALAACVEEALNRSALPVAADSDGPGFVTSRDLSVRGYRIAFEDDEKGAVARASARQANVLLGPRADRCQGLYTHDPPRDASALFAEIAQGEAKAASVAEVDRDMYAREMQKAYDAELELRERLRLDAQEPGLPRANRMRMLKALDSVDRSARRRGAAIGCRLSPLPP